MLERLAAKCEREAKALADGRVELLAPSRTPALDRLATEARRRHLK